MKDFDPFEKEVINGITFNCKVYPDINLNKLIKEKEVEINKVLFDLEVTKKLENSNVEFNLSIEGELLSFMKNKNEFYVELKVTSKF